MNSLFRNVGHSGWNGWKDIHGCCQVFLAWQRLQNKHSTLFFFFNTKVLEWPSMHKPNPTEKEPRNEGHAQKKLIIWLKVFSWKHWNNIPGKKKKNVSQVWINRFISHAYLGNSAQTGRVRPIRRTVIIGEKKQTLGLSSFSAQLDFLTATCNSCFLLAERLLTASPPCGKPWCNIWLNTCQSQ